MSCFYFVCHSLLRRINTLSRGVRLSKWYRFPSEKGCVFEGMGANFFLINEGSFSEEVVVQKNKLEVTEIVSICELSPLAKEYQVSFTRNTLCWNIHL